MVIDFQNVNICLHNGTELLKDVSLQVNEGEFVYIIGQVGTGKTSLLRTIDGELRPKEGSAEVLGRNLITLKRRHVPALRRELGIVFQDFKLLPDRTVEANLQFALRATGWKDKKERRERIEEVMEQVGLADKLAKFPHELSGGEQQRVAIARAILNHPKLVLADEPSGNLDPTNAENIMRILYKIKEAGAAVVMVTHNKQLIESHPEKTYVCEEGCFKAL